MVQTSFRIIQQRRKELCDTSHWGSFGRDVLGWAAFGTAIASRGTSSNPLASWRICKRNLGAKTESREVRLMKSDGPLILAVLFLAAGLATIFGYGVGTGSFNAAYPFSAANLQMSISTAGPAAVGGMALLAVGILVLVWALAAAIVGLFVGFGTDRGRADRLERQERKRLEREERLLAREERLNRSIPRI